MNDGVMIPLTWVAAVAATIVGAFGALWFALKYRTDSHLSDVKDMHKQAMDQMKVTTSELSKICNEIGHLSSNMQESNRINGETITLLKSSMEVNRRK